LLGIYRYNSNDAKIDILHPAFLFKGFKPKTTTIHENIHALTRGDKALLPEAKRNFKAAFGNQESKYDKYLTEPTEIHARIGEIRNHFNLTPESLIYDEYVDDIIKQGLKGKTPVDERFFQLIKDKEQFKWLMNNAPAVALPIVGAAALQEKQKGGSITGYNWFDKYKQVADNTSTQYVPKTVEEYNQLNPNLKDQEFLASHPAQQFVPYVTPTSTYHKEAIDKKKKEFEQKLFREDGRNSDGEYKFLRKPRPELNKWVDQIGLPVLEGASLIGGVGEGYQLLKSTGKLGRLGMIKALGRDILEKPSTFLKNNKVVQGFDNTLTAVGNKANVLGMDPIGAMIDHQVKGLNTAVNVNWGWNNNTRQYVPNFNWTPSNIGAKYTSDLYDGIGPDQVTSPVPVIRDLNIGRETPKFKNGGSFSEAFRKARKKLGANNVFEWNGNKYTTNYKEEVLKRKLKNNEIENQLF